MVSYFGGCYPSAAMSDAIDINLNISPPFSIHDIVNMNVNIGKATFRQKQQPAFHFMLMLLT